jgi:hypothetical protein
MPCAAIEAQLKFKEKQKTQNPIQYLQRFAAKMLCESDQSTFGSDL